MLGDTDPTVDTDTLAVRATQTSNSAPKFDDTDPVAEGDQNDPRERKVKENTSGFVGTAVMAADDDTTTTAGVPARTDTVTHSIGGPDGDLFEVNQSDWSDLGGQPARSSTSRRRRTPTR